MEDYLLELNERQREAVLYTDGPQLVIAGAGSGKTRVLTYKIVHLMNIGFSPYRIMALTFTNKAAREMKERIAPLVGEDNAALLWMGTFHSIFSKLLHINAERIGFSRNFTIYDTDDSKSLIKMIVKDMNLDDKIYKPSSIQSHISNMKNALISPADYERNSELRQADERAQRPYTFAIYKAYWNRCRIADAMDFDDLLFYTNILLRDNKDILHKYQDMFQYVLVDEYQDTNFAQHMIVSQLCREHQRLCVVGDDAQSIYSFRGANISNILNLKRYYPKLMTFKLEQNYRSTQCIIEAANSLIAKNKQQIPKHIFSENGKGEPISVVESYSDFEESYVVANYIISTKAHQGGSYNDFAVLYRTNAQSRTLEEALRKRNIPYIIYGGLSFYQRKEVKDAIAYFRLTTNPSDDEALRRIINTPTRGIGNTTIGKLQAAAIRYDVPIWKIISHIDKYDIGINSGTKSKLSKFYNLMTAFIESFQNGAEAYELANKIIATTGLISSLQSSNTPENISKIENLNELLNAVQEFSNEKEEQGEERTSLLDFLSEISLATDEDKNSDDGINVKLMTVHASKGLEFKNVIIVGVEEDLFPATMSSDSIYGIEEERRLPYVAITRAKSTCLITYAKQRYKNGQQKDCVASRFIRDLDTKYLAINSSAANSLSAKPKSSDFNRIRDLWNTNSTPTHLRAETFSNQSKPLPTFSSTSGGDFAIHSADELQNGCKIEHSRFGFGTITAIDTSGDNAKAIVAFNEVGTKTLLLKFAKFKIL